MLRPRAVAEPTYELWRTREPFASLTDDEARAVEPHLAVLHVPAGAYLFHEGDEAKDFFLLLGGDLEIRKREERRAIEHVIGRVASGETVGELGVLDESRRAAAVRARTAAVVVSVRWAPLQATEEAAASPLRGAYRKLRRALLASVVQQLRAQGVSAASAAQTRVAMGDLIVSLLILFCAYVLLFGSLPYLDEAIPWDVALLSFPIQLVFGVVGWRLMRSSGFPLSEHGLGVRHLFGSLLEGVLFTVPLLGVVTGIKAAVMVWSGSFGRLPLLEHTDVPSRLASPHVQSWLAIYAVSCLVQELVVRGALQSTFMRFLTGPRAIARAIWVTGLLFAVTHLHLGLQFALAALAPGLFWGWLYARKPSLAGVTLSHFAVGAYVFFFLGLRVS